MEYSARSKKAPGTHIRDFLQKKNRPKLPNDSKFDSTRVEGQRLTTAKEADPVGWKPGSPVCSLELLSTTNVEEPIG
jgi:hypothetical protein